MLTDITKARLPSLRSAALALLTLAATGAVAADEALRAGHLSYATVLLLLAALSVGWLLIVSRLRRAAHAEARRFALVLDAAPEGIIGVSDSGAICFANARVAEIFGYAEAELIGEPVERLIPDRFHESHVASRARYVREPRARPMDRSGALVARRRDGSELPVEVSLNRIPMGEEHIVLCIIRDVAEQRRTREALVTANRELESSIVAMRRRTRELHELTSLSELLQSCVHEHEIYPLVCAALARLFPEVAGGLYLLNPSRTLAQLVGDWNCTPGQLAVTFAPQDCWALRRGRVHRCEPTDSVLRCQHVPPDARASATLCVPMAAQGETVGLLCVWGRTGTDAADPGHHQQLLRAFAEQCSLAGANLRLREALRNQSVRDPLTGLFNRRFLEEWLERELQRTARLGSSLALLLIDFDHFKRFNDTFGHQSGDIALRESCAILQRRTRGSDVVCRFGGEEIVVLLPDAALAAALQVAEELRAAVEQNVVRHQTNTLGSLTISIGVACSPDQGRSSEALLRAADIALYAAKQEGRNRVVSAGRADFQAQSATEDTRCA